MFTWLQNHLLPCAYKSLFGIECPLCGSQRAFIFLLKGDWKDSFQMYPPLIPVLSLVILCMVHYFKKPFHQRFIYRYSVLVLIIVALNYSIKLAGS